MKKTVRRKWKKLLLGAVSHAMRVGSPTLTAYENENIHSLKGKPHGKNGAGKIRARLSYGLTKTKKKASVAFGLRVMYGWPLLYKDNDSCRYYCSHRLHPRICLCPGQPPNKAGWTAGQRTAQHTRQKEKLLWTCAAV